MKRAQLLQQAHSVILSGPTIQYTTWDPAKKSAGVTLSGGNLVATCNNAATVLSVVGKSSGKWYWEYRPGAVFMSLGIQKNSGGYEQFLGANVNGWGYRGSSSSIMNDNTFIQSGLASYTAGDVISIALNLDTNQITWRKNDVVQGVAQTIAAGTWFAAVSGVVSGGAQSVTANFGASAFTYTPPAGFNAGLYE